MSQLGSQRPPRQLTRWLITIAVIIVLAFLIQSRQRDEAQRKAATDSSRDSSVEIAPPAIDEERIAETERTASRPDFVTPTRENAATTESPSKLDETLIVRNVTIKSESGRVVFRGDVDLSSTLARIERGERHSHRNDGGPFRNLEGRLPKKPSGYYTEYVHPTPGLDGPGPQRVVLGKQGEVYYTHDHYRSFHKLR